MFKLVRRALVILAASLACTLAAAQPYPSRTIKIVVPYGAGGATDIFARAYAAELGARLKQTVVVENVPGAGGTIGAQRVMDTAPDGYTLIVCTGIEFEMLQIADPDSAKGRRTNLTPVTLIGTQPMVLVARPALGLRSADDLVRTARARPGALSLASAGPGTSLHLAGEMIKKAAGIDLLNVPYKATPQMVTDLAGGNVDLALLAMPTAIPHVRSGALVALAVTDSTRSAALPDTPTLGESSSVRGVDTKVWYGVFGPPGMSANLVQALGEASATMLRDTAFREKLLGMMITPSQQGSASELETVRTAQLAGFLRALGAGGR
jgi:tripartite-type tricarboxylate transporter receptor subunit TctC